MAPGEAHARGEPSPSTNPIPRAPSVPRDTYLTFAHYTSEVGDKDHNKLIIEDPLAAKIKDRLELDNSAGGYGHLIFELAGGWSLENFGSASQKVKTRGTLNFVDGEPKNVYLHGCEPEVDQLIKSSQTSARISVSSDNKLIIDFGTDFWLKRHNSGGQSRWVITDSIMRLRHYGQEYGPSQINESFPSPSQAHSDLGDVVDTSPQAGCFKYLYHAQTLPLALSELGEIIGRDQEGKDKYRSDDGRARYEISENLGVFVSKAENFKAIGLGKEPDFLLTKEDFSVVDTTNPVTSRPLEEPEAVTENSEEAEEASPTLDRSTTAHNSRWGLRLPGDAKISARRHRTLDGIFSRGEGGNAREDGSGEEIARHKIKVYWQKEGAERAHVGTFEHEALLFLMLHIDLDAAAALKGVKGLTGDPSEEQIQEVSNSLFPGDDGGVDTEAIQHARGEVEKVVKKIICTIYNDRPSDFTPAETIECPDS